MRSTTSRPGLLVERRRRLVGEHDGAARPTSARAIATRWRWPPESSCARLSTCAAEPDRLEHRARAAPQLAAAGSGRSRAAPSRRSARGQRLEQVVRLEDEADAAAHALERRARRRRAAPAPSTRTLPSCAARSAPISVSSVVLPEPDGPVTMTISPRAIVGRRRRTGSACAARPCRRGGSRPLDDRSGVRRRSSEHLRRVERCAPCAARGARRARTSRASRPNTTSARSTRHVQRQARGVAATRYRQTRRRERRARSRAPPGSAACCSTTPDTKPLRVADRAQRRVLVQVVGDVGEQDLVDDDRADDEADDRAEREDEADRRGAVPVGAARGRRSPAWSAPARPSAAARAARRAPRPGRRRPAAGSGRAGSRRAGDRETAAASCRCW